MNKLFAAIVLFVCSFSATAQQLTLGDLTYMLQHNIHEDSAYVAEKGFIHFATHETAFCNDMTWVEISQDTTKGPGTLLFKMTCNGNNDEIGYEFYDQSLLNTLMDEAVGSNMVIELEEDRPDGTFYEEYANEDLSMGFLTGTHEDGHSYFTVTLVARQ